MRLLLLTILLNFGICEPTSNAKEIEDPSFLFQRGMSLLVHWAYFSIMNKSTLRPFPTLRLPASMEYQSH